jgi:DNA-binding NarL/FixJ family response regulator
VGHFSDVDSDAQAVLVVDDDAGCRTLIVELLERIGCAVVEASTGHEALILAKASRPALVLLDIGIPGISGYEVCAELRETYGETLPVIFISGIRVESQDRVAGLLIGADDYIVKPFDGDELLARVRRLLVRKTENDRFVETRTRSSAAVASLTGRERQVLVLLARGQNQSQIAGELFISSKTVATHIQHILGKLGLHSRAEAVALAHRERLTADVEAHAFVPVRLA